MEIFTAKLQREHHDRHHAQLKLPLELLRRAQIDPWDDVVLYVDEQKIVIEAINQDTEQMEMYAEEFVSSHLDALRKLGDEPCLPIG